MLLHTLRERGKEKEKEKETAGDLHLETATDIIMHALTFCDGIAISTDWKGTSYNSILVVVDRVGSGPSSGAVF